MGWLEKQAAGRSESEVTREHGRYVRAAAVDRALDHISGPFGCRRFVVRFERVGGAVRVTRLDAVPLQWGGGPPPEDPTGERTRELEKALSALHRNMATGPAWTSGAIGYLRDARGRVSLFPLFDEDADLADVSALPVPGPPGHPLEDPAYLGLLAQHGPRMGRVQQRTQGIAHVWDRWEIKDDTLLLLHYEIDGQGRPRETVRRRCQVLGTFEPARSLFTWQMASPPFPEPIYREPAFPADYAASTELALLTAARMGADWLFVQPYDDRGSLLLAAAWD